MNALDVRLLERAREQDRQALDLILRQALPTVLGWTARMGGPRVDHEDAAHDVLLVVMRRIHQLERPEQFHSWLFSITRRVLAQHRRKAWVRKWVPGAEVDGTDEGMGPLRRSVIGDTSHKVRLALDELPPDQREVLVLCDLEERTGPEVAEMLGVPLGTVKSRLRLGRAHFARAARQRGLASLALEQS